MINYTHAEIKLMLPRLIYYETATDYRYKYSFRRKISVKLFYNMPILKIKLKI